MHPAKSDFDRSLVPGVWDEGNPSGSLYFDSAVYQLL